MRGCAANQETEDHPWPDRLKNFLWHGAGILLPSLRFMNSCKAGRGHALLCKLALCCFLGVFPAGAQPIRDGGINPANLGKGDWIWYVSWATNQLGGSAPSVVNLPTLMAYYKSVGMQYVIVKAGTGSTNFNGGGASPQFNSNLVHHAHAAGLLIFAYTRSYDDDVPGEIDMAARYFALGADGWVIDAEAEWENGANQAGTNGPARAIQYGQGLRALFPNKFIAHAPFPIIRFHSSFPYKEFGYYCDAVMPQAYWTEIYNDSPTAVATMFATMDAEYRTWQNSLSGIWTNAIKPIAPIAQAWSSTSGTTTGAEIDEFFDRLRTNVNPASVTGYKGISFWRADLKTTDMWSAIQTNALGDAPGPPVLTMQPQGRTVPPGHSNVTFTAWGTGSKPFYYRWRFNGTNLPGATSPNLVFTNVQLAQAGAYSVVVSNVSGVTTSVVAMLNVEEASPLLNVAASSGGRSAIITWDSTNASSSQVEFGFTTSYGVVTPEDVRPVTNHSVLLSGLVPDTNYFFAVISRAGTNTWRSGGWSFSTALDLILDNTDATYTGNWTVGTSSPDKFGADYRFAGTVTGGSTASAIYTPLISTPGRYDVYVWYPQGGNRSTNTPISIFYNGGSLTTRINQESGGGGWRIVGTNLNFRPGTSGFVRIHNGTGESDQVVMADAVRFAYRVEQDAPEGPAVPDWWAYHYFGSSVNAQLDHDGDGSPAWMEYLAGTNPKDATSCLQFTLATAGGEMLQARFTPYTAGRGYVLQRSSDFDSWLALPGLPVNADASGQGSINVTNLFEPVSLYRLRIEWSP